MHTITQTSWLPYSPQTIYDVLTSPEKLATIVKRLKSIEVVSREGETGDVIAVLDLPGGKTLRTRGRVLGDIGQSLVFSTDEPVHLVIAWALEEQVQDGQIGTLVNYCVEVDFSPVAAFVSSIVLKGYLASEMKRDLQTLADLLTAEFTIA